MARPEITVTKAFPSGAWVFAAYDDAGFLLTRCQYQGYTQREAMKLFRQEVKEATR